MKTIKIKTGKRTWNLTLKGAERGMWILESDSGLTYWLSQSGWEMSGRNRTKTRTYTWGVTNGREVREALGVMPREQRAA